jgi:hypothetical protein
VTVSSLAGLSFSLVSLCYLSFLELYPTAYVAWMSEATWLRLWQVGFVAALLGGLLGIFGRGGLRALLGASGLLLTFAWVIAMSIAEPGA